MYKREFNPVLFLEDDPDFQYPNIQYSIEVTHEMNRIRRFDSILFVFLVWWFNVPAILKGYIDRVFNYGFSYEPSKLPINKIRWVGIAGEPESHFKKRKFDEMMIHYLNIGISTFNGVKDTEVYLIYNSLAEEIREEDIDKHYKEMFKNACEIGEKM